jgi:carbon-monoxide dehydrogenase medium subunit
MEICDFVYHRPATPAEACALGLRYGRDARFLAGGTELLPDLKQHRDSTQHLIDLNGLEGLSRIARDGNHLVLGALLTLSEIAESPLVHEHCPALTEAILTMAALQIRNRGTLGGNFCGGVPSADTPPICLAVNAEVRLVAPDDERTVRAEDFFLSPRRVDLRPGEILTEIRIPVARPGSGASYERFALRRATALAVVGAAAWMQIAGREIRETRLALGAVAPVPLLARRAMELLAGRTADEKLLTAAAELAAEEARPITDLRGSAGYRRQLVRVLAFRAMRRAAARAMGAAGEGELR